MLHPPIAEVANPLPIMAMLLVFWAGASLAVAAIAVGVVGPRRPAALVLPATLGFLVGLVGGGWNGALPFLIATAVIAALIQRRWLGEPGPAGPEALPWGHQPAALIVARRRALRRSREAEATRDAAPD